MIRDVSFVKGPLVISGQCIRSAKSDQDPHCPLKLIPSVSSKRSYTAYLLIILRRCTVRVRSIFEKFSIYLSYESGPYGMYGTCVSLSDILGETNTVLYGVDTSVIDVPVFEHGTLSTDDVCSVSGVSNRNSRAADRNTSVRDKPQSDPIADLTLLF